MTYKTNGVMICDWCGLHVPVPEYPSDNMGREEREQFHERQWDMFGEWIEIGAIYITLNEMLKKVPAEGDYHNANCALLALTAAVSL